MKNNALTKAEKEDFILRYEIDREGKIWVWHPSGKDKNPIENTPENINYLNQKNLRVLNFLSNNL